MTGAFVSHTLLSFGKFLSRDEYKFSWLLVQNCILTRDNLSKRRHLSDYTCLFCSESETIHNLFFDSVVSKQIWDMLVKFCQGIHIKTLNLYIQLGCLTTLSPVLLLLLLPFYGPYGNVGMVSVSRKTMVKFGDGLGSCNITVEEVDDAIQGVAILPN